MNKLIESKRRTGRTTRMLTQAMVNLLLGKRTEVVGATVPHTIYLMEQFIELLQQHNVPFSYYQSSRMVAHGQEDVYFVVQASVDGTERDIEVLFDHYTVEESLLEVLKKWERWDA